MAKLAFIACLASLYLLRGTEVFTVAVIVTVVNLISLGIFSNFKDDVFAAPNWAVNANLITSIVGVGLLIYGFLI